MESLSFKQQSMRIQLTIQSLATKWHRKSPSLLCQACIFCYDASEEDRDGLGRCRFCKCDPKICRQQGNFGYIHEIDINIPIQLSEESIIDIYRRYKPFRKMLRHMQSLFCAMIETEEKKYQMKEWSEQ